MSFWKRKTNIKLVVGLGNPGQDYSGSRHNIGFACLNHFARMHSIRFDKKRCRARIGSGRVAGGEVVLAKPQTYMNRSGESVAALVRRFRVSLDNLIVVHDDLDLPPGKVRIRQGGGSAGHKGIDSIINHLGSPDFTRIRIGIGRPPAKESPTATEDDIIKYVLSPFTADEEQTITEVIPQVSEAVYCLLTEGITVAMNRFN